MEFRFEDILKNIIPGGVLLAAVAFCFFMSAPANQLNTTALSDLKEYSSLLLVVALILLYLTGFVIDAVSSLLEYHIVHRFLGRPSYKLLTGKGKRIRLLSSFDIMENIRAKFPNDNVLTFTGNKKKNKEVALRFFQYANILKSQNEKIENSPLIKEYYYSYVFSRNLFFSAFFSVILIAILLGSVISSHVYIIMVGICALLFSRRRDRDFYYSRQVLIVSKY